MPSSLKDFYLNENMRNEVQTYLIDFLKVQTIEKAFNGESTEHIKDANEVLEKAFSNLEVMFSPKSEAKEIKNEAR